MSGASSTLAGGGDLEEGLGDMAAATVEVLSVVQRPQEPQQQQRQRPALLLRGVHPSPDTVLVNVAGTKYSVGELCTGSHGQPKACYVILQGQELGSLAPQN